MNCFGPGFNPHQLIECIAVRARKGIERLRSGFSHNTSPQRTARRAALDAAFATNSPPTPTARPRGLRMVGRTLPKWPVSASPQALFGSRSASREFLPIQLPRLANSSLRIRREGCVRNGAAKKIERFLERAIVLFVRRHVGLRARTLQHLRSAIHRQIDKRASGPPLVARTILSRSKPADVRLGAEGLRRKLISGRVKRLRRAEVVDPIYI